MPTGTTPMRQVFTYPRQLVRTRPHADILEEFRNTSTVGDKDAVVHEVVEEEAAAEEPQPTSNQENDIE